MSDQIVDSLIVEAGEYSVRDFAIYRHTVYIDSINVGLASTADADPCAEIANTGRMHEMTTIELAQLLHSSEILEAAVGLAAINASLDLNKSKDGLVRKNAVKILREKGEGKNVSIIGHFPFVESFIKDGACENVWVFELNPRSPDDLSSDLIPKYVPQSDVVLISGTTLINHSFQGVVELCENSYNIVLGPSTPLTPILFDFGIDVVCGAIVADKEKAKLSFAQGARFREAAGLEFVSLMK
ncbi:MAG: hypothetical protein JSW64_15015 [Candidatus Zixiibacteriota bacterium]|nr:MAG: hypothetical protein JSW64_15015 [candidate division Zixibacteria bacterium]